MKNKQELASVLLSEKFNIDYKNNDGTTLLMFIILSDLKIEWKINAI